MNLYRMVRVTWTLIKVFPVAFISAYKNVGSAASSRGCIYIALLSSISGSPLLCCWFKKQFTGTSYLKTAILFPSWSQSDEWVQSIQWSILKKMYQKIWLLWKGLTGHTWWATSFQTKYNLFLICLLFIGRHTVSPLYVSCHALEGEGKATELIKVVRRNLGKNTQFE